MARQKKIKSVQEDEKTEVCMTEAALLESLETEIDQKRIELEGIKRTIAEQQAAMVTSAKRDISDDEKVIVDKQVTMSAEKISLKAKIERQRQYDSVMITGRFINRRAPGQSAKLTYQKYEGDPVKWYVFEDGKTYTIPRGFADQINEHYHSPVFVKKEGPMDPNQPSSQIHDVDTSNKKYLFSPISF